MLFFVGILEMLVITVWTNLVTRTKVLASGVVTMINVLIWFFVIQTVVDNINNWGIAITYALGCAIGTAGSTYVLRILDKRKKAARRAKKNQFLPNSLKTKLTSIE